MNKRLREYECLCTLGLPSAELTPIAIDLMEKIMPGTQFCLTRADAQFEVIDCYMKEPIPDTYAHLYAERFHNRLEAEAGPTFVEMLRERIPLLNYSAQGARFYSSALFTELFRPLGLQHGARVLVCHGDHRFGTLSASRPQGGRPFSPRDEEILLRLARLLAQALELERRDLLLQEEVADDIGEGILLFDAEGNLLQGCPAGLRMFHEATRDNGAGQQPAPTRAALPIELVKRAVSAAESAEVAVATHRGQFGFRPTLMQAAGAGAPARVAVKVRRRGSIASRLWLESAGFPLSARERQVAVLLGTGYSYEQIAERLSLSRNTAVSYVRRTYEKLQVRHREQLLRAMLAARI